MKIEMWPNGCGAIVTSGRLKIEVWEHGGCRRIVGDDSLTGFYGTHFARVAVGTIAEMCKAAVELWKTNRAAWSECE